mmetsp:Transcript_119604/g.374133  ORF Transcript_119604/g.374133 Transcript_119604/m.374133 type:complete len:241 (+) Transcript_119604:79-801(+)
MRCLGPSSCPRCVVPAATPHRRCTGSATQTSFQARVCLDPTVGCLHGAGLGDRGSIVALGVACLAALARLASLAWADCGAPLGVARGTAFGAPWLASLARAAWGATLSWAARGTALGAARAASLARGASLARAARCTPWRATIGVVGAVVVRDVCGLTREDAEEFLEIDAAQPRDGIPARLSVVATAAGRAAGGTPVVPNGDVVEDLRVPVQQRIEEAHLRLPSFKPLRVDEGYHACKGG